jgi:hypothetical protein
VKDEDDFRVEASTDGHFEILDIPCRGKEAIETKGESADPKCVFNPEPAKAIIEKAFQELKMLREGRQPELEMLRMRTQQEMERHLETADADFARELAVAESQLRYEHQVEKLSF